jgi:hypothetical protein
MVPLRNYAVVVARVLFCLRIWCKVTGFREYIISIEDLTRHNFNNKRVVTGNLYLYFCFMAIINEPLELGMGNFVLRYPINIPKITNEKL